MTEATARQSTMSHEEWEVRKDLAAAYRLVALYDWEDLVFTHLSARVPGPEHHFLINPYGMLFDEITASSLVKVDRDGEIVDPEATCGRQRAWVQPCRRRRAAAWSAGVLAATTAPPEPAGPPSQVVTTPPAASTIGMCATMS